MTDKMLNNRITQLSNSQILVPTTKLGLDFVKKHESEKSDNVVDILHENGYALKGIMNKSVLSHDDKLDMIKMIIYLIAPHNQYDIIKTEDDRLNKIRYYFFKFDIDVNMNEPHFFSTFLNFAIFFRQEKIVSYFIDIGADINMTDSLGLSPLNYIASKVLIGDPGQGVNNMFNNLRDRITDKGMVNMLKKMMNHSTQKLEYFHKNPAAGYALYDAYATSQIPNMSSASEYLEVYEILSNKIREINSDKELIKHYAVEIEEFRNSFSAENTTPQYFDRFKSIKKGNIFEFILAGDENGAINYLKENPFCIEETDIDLQSPLQWAIFMSQKDKPKKCLNLIVELIKAGADVEHKNITGYNSIELAAWYDYCDDLKTGKDTYSILNKIDKGLMEVDTDSSTKCKKHIEKYQLYKKNYLMNNNIRKVNNTPILRLKLKDNKFDEHEKKLNQKEIKDMFLEDIRTQELNEKAILDLYDREEQDNLKLSKKSEKNKLKKLSKKLKDAERKAQRNAKLKAQEESKLAIKKDNEEKKKAIREAKLKVEEEAKLKAEQEAKLKAEQQAKKLKLKEEHEAKLLESKKLKEQQIMIQKQLEEERNAKLKVEKENKKKLIESKKLKEKQVKIQKQLDDEREAKKEAEKEATIAKLAAIKATEMLDSVKNENIEIKAEFEQIKNENILMKTENESNEKESCTSDITDPEDQSENNNVQVLFDCYGNQIDVNGNIIYFHPNYRLQVENMQANFVGPAFNTKMPIHVPSNFVPQQNFVNTQFNPNMYMQNSYIQEEHLNYSWPYPYQPTGTVYYS